MLHLLNAQGKVLTPDLLLNLLDQSARYLGEDAAGVRLEAESDGGGHGILLRVRLFRQRDQAGEAGLDWTASFRVLREGKPILAETRRCGADAERLRRESFPALGSALEQVLGAAPAQAFPVQAILRRTP